MGWLRWYTDPLSPGQIRPLYPVPIDPFPAPRDARSSTPDGPNLPPIPPLLGLQMGPRTLLQDPELTPELASGTPNWTPGYPSGTLGWARQTRRTLGLGTSN